MWRPRKCDLNPAGLPSRSLGFKLVGEDQNTLSSFSLSHCSETPKGPTIQAGGIENEVGARVSRPVLRTGRPRTEGR